MYVSLILVLVLVLALVWHNCVLLLSSLLTQPCINWTFLAAKLLTTS